MSVRTMARVWEGSAHSGTHLLMLLAIADFADDDGRAYPSVATLARKCRMKSRNANVILAALKASGELDVMLGRGPRGTNLYRVKFEALGLQERAGVQERAGCKGLPNPLQPDAPPPCKGLPETPAKPCSQTINDPSLNHHEPAAPRKRGPQRAAARGGSSGLAVGKTKADTLRNFGGKDYRQGVNDDGSIA